MTNSEELERRCASEFPVLTSTLFMSDLDPFELFKEPPPGEHGKFIENPKSRSSKSLLDCKLEHTERDRLRDRFARFNRIFMTYFLVKGFSMSAVQSFLLRAERLQRADVTRGRADLWQSNRVNSFVRLVIQTLGNPMALLNEFSIFFYSTLPALGFMRFCVVAKYYHKRRNFDMAYLRFLLAPRLEQTRLDASAGQRLNELESSVWNYELNRIEMIRLVSDKLRAWKRKNNERTTTMQTNTSTSIKGKEGARVEWRLRFLSSSCRVGRAEERLQRLEEILRGTRLSENCARVRRLLRELVKEQKDLQSLRPDVFQCEWHEKMGARMRHISNATFMVFWIWALLTVFAAVYVTNTSTMCNMNSEKGQAGLGSGLELLCRSLTLGDAVVVFEMVFASLICVFTECNQALLCCLNIMNLTRMIKSMNNELSLCEHELAGHRQACELDDCQPPQDGAQASSVARARTEAGRARDKMLLKQLAKLIVFEAEMVDGFRATTGLISILGQYAVSALILLLVGLQQTGHQSSLVRTFNFTFVWFWLNVVSLLCCFVHAHFIQLERHYWSILAQMVIIQQLEESSNAQHAQVVRSPERPRGADVLHGASSLSLGDQKKPKTRIALTIDLTGEITSLEIIKTLWQKFLLATGTNIDQYCVRPFGFHLTYARMLQLNFMAIFIYSPTLNNHREVGPISAREPHWSLP